MFTRPLVFILASVGLSACATPRAEKAMEHLHPWNAALGPPDVWANESENSVRRIYRGVVTEIAAGAQGAAARVSLRGKLRRLGPGNSISGEVELPVNANTPDKDSFLLQLPAAIPLPFQVGDSVEAELATVEVGAMAFDHHARIVDSKGQPLLFLRGLPPGWNVDLGKRLRADQSPGINQYSVTVTPPGQKSLDVSGWASGEVAGVPCAVFGTAMILDRREDVPPPNDWVDVFSIAWVKLRAPSDR